MHLQAACGQLLIETPSEIGKGGERDSRQGIGFGVLTVPAIR